MLTQRMEDVWSLCSRLPEARALVIPALVGVPPGVGARAKAPAFLPVLLEAVQLLEA